jgi:hypothetical protein
MHDTGGAGSWPVSGWVPTPFQLVPLGRNSSPATIAGFTGRAIGVPPTSAVSALP